MASRLHPTDVPEGRSARRRRLRTVRRRRALALLVGVGVVVVLSVAVVRGLQGRADPPEEPPAAAGPTPAASLPVPVLAGVPAAAPPASGCDSQAVTDALASGDDAAVVSALGGAAAFRESVAAGTAPCIDLADPDRVWVVVNKRRPYVPLDWAPASITLPEDVRNLAGGGLDPVAAGALGELVRAAKAEGAGEIALASAYRSYRTQRSSYSEQQDAEGTGRAEVSVARPGYSEHQSGLTTDVVACDRVCGTLDDLAGTPQDRWIVDHAWEHGWIVRYETGYTGITGYLPEPWHLRYIGKDLARAYHDGGWRSLEEFFGLPPAPDY